MSANLAGFLGVVLIAYVIPGPDFLVVVRAAAQRPALGRAAALGAQSGLCVHVLAAALGLSVLAAQSAAVFTTIKVAGAAYLVYLGVRALLAARSGSAPAPERTGAAPDGSGAAPAPAAFGRRAAFTEGFLTNVLNPKAALFFLSVLPQFIEHGGPSTTSQIFLLGALDVAVGVVYWAGLVPVAAKLRALLDRPSVRRRWERITGCLFIGIGVGVAVAD
ncbi:LysE family translocator [Streptomyces candidus]|uniref:Threonine/homoserine/homoserine lactone efflux protein n=1 Tax=Streptomyces candidus TaxID=67283 RepID=A0A7X0HJZ4_9ACTN|nr:LysE family translocator [Streptomyces candidus]MBB6439001.1 threonine/homoserine/homoserine lactone efflux protein [Streptomyces candidus]GHH44566.1 lysine transporter LysE [Streptomyces candidus]